MHARRDAVVFGVSLVALSAALGWLFSHTPGSVGYYLDIGMLAVPVTSAMLASVGFSWRRKLTYASITLGLYVLSGFVAETTGLHDVVRQQVTAASAFPGVGTILYMVWLTTFPFAMLVLFVGRRPSLLWSRDGE